MTFKYLFLLGLCIVGAIAYRNHENDNEQRKLQQTNQNNALADISNSEASSLEEDSLTDPLLDDLNLPKENPKWEKNGRRKNRRWRKNKCRSGTENNNEQSVVKCDRYRHRGGCRREDKENKDSQEEENNENKYDGHHYHHNHHRRGNKTETDDSVHGQDVKSVRHHYKCRKHERKQSKQTDDQNESQIENEEGRREKHHHRGWHHRGNKNENGESVHGSEWHENHNFPTAGGKNDVDRRIHHHRHHHHHHHCHNKTTTTSTTPTPSSSTVNDEPVPDFDIRANVE